MSYGYPCIHGKFGWCAGCANVWPQTFFPAQPAPVVILKCDGCGQQFAHQYYQEEPFPVFCGRCRRTAEEKAAATAEKPTGESA